MGLLDELQSLAGGSGVGAEEHASVARELVGAVSEHPGGVGGVLDELRQGGLGQHVDSWVAGTPGANASGPQGAVAPLSQSQVEQGVPSGLLARISERTGLPPQVVTAALTTALPMVMQHLTPGGQVPAQGQTGGLAQQLLGRLL